MKFEAEYSVTIKLDSIYMPPGHSSDELNEVIQQIGRDNLKKYFNNISNLHMNQGEQLIN